MCKVKITCSKEDKEWLEGAIFSYCVEFAGTPPWVDQSKSVEEVAMDGKLTEDVTWDICEGEIVPAPCYECGGTAVTMNAEYNEFPSEARGFYIECKECGARTGFHRKREGAIKSWNRKAGIPVE